MTGLTLKPVFLNRNFMLNIVLETADGEFVNDHHISVTTCLRG